MKKLILFAVLILSGTSLNVLAQSNESDYSLSGISQALKNFRVTGLWPFHDGFAKVQCQKGNVFFYGIINKQGKWVVPCNYKKVGYFSEGLVYAKDVNDKYGYYDVDGNIAINFNLDAAKSFSEEVAFVTYKGADLCINKKGQSIMQLPKLRDSWPFYEGVAPIITEEENNKIYFMDLSGKAACLPLSCNIEGLGFDGVYIIKGKNYGLIDKIGNILAPTQYSEMDVFTDGLSAVKRKIDGEYLCGYIDLTGKEIIVPQYEEGEKFSEGLAAVRKGGKWGYINKQGTVVIPCQYKFARDFHEGLAAVSDGDKWGYINKKGTLVIPYIYSSAGIFCDGLAVVKEVFNGKRGYINKEGKLMIPFKFDDGDASFGNFDKGYSIVYANKGYGVIDKQGNTIIPTGIYSTFNEFTEGLSVVMKDNQWGFIDINGNSTFDY